MENLLFKKKIAPRIPLSKKGHRVLDRGCCDLYSTQKGDVFRLWFKGEIFLILGLKYQECRISVLHCLVSLFIEFCRQIIFLKMNSLFFTGQKKAGGGGNQGTCVEQLYCVLSVLLLDTPSLELFLSPLKSEIKSPQFTNSAVQTQQYAGCVVLE